MLESIEKDLTQIERRENHLWAVAITLLLTFVSATPLAYYVISVNGTGVSRLDSALTLRALTGISALTLVFCTYVVITRMGFSRVRRLFEAQAIRDSLTGLLNRQSFADRIMHEVLRANRDNTSLGIMLCDLDKFKEINDTHGHPIGDLVLQKTSAAILKATRGSDLVFRWGGDEVLVLLAPTVRMGALSAAERIRDGVREFADESGIRADLSIGLAFYPEHGRNVEELIALADKALYIAKKSGDKVHVGEEELPIDDNAVSLVFQPVVDSGSRTTLGYEVLSRDPEGKVSVSDLFRRYEAVGQLAEFKRMILTSQIRAAEEHGLDRIFINIDFALLDSLEPLPKPPNVEVVLEISESETVRSIEKYIDVVNAWRKEGYKFAIDDFGSGFMSLPFVAQLLPSFIKMDRSTILEASGDAQFSSFMRDIVSAMRNYSGEGIIAEGIETEEELRVVRELGVDQIQGHLTGSPVSMSDNLAQAEANERSRATTGPETQPVMPAETVPAETPSESPPPETAPVS